MLGVIAAVTFALMFLVDRQRGDAAEDVGAQRAVADRGVRCDGVDLPGRPSGRAGHHAHGTLVASVPVLLFCIAFGLSMDYEVFLVSRIREFWSASRRRRTHAATTTKAWRWAWRTPAV